VTALTAAPGARRALVRWSRLARLRPYAGVLGLWAIWRVAHLAMFLAVGGTPDNGAHAWDSAWYLRILRDGYALDPTTGAFQPTNFFPLLPWLTGAVQLVVRSETVAMNLVLAAAQLGAVLALFAAARQCASHRTATVTVGLFLLFPASVHLWFFYTEGLFVALTAACLCAAERGRMRLAALLGVAVSMTRSMGVLVAVALAVSVVQRRRRLDREVAWAAVPTVGLAVVCLAQWAAVGDPFAFMESSKAWGTRTQWPVVTIWERLEITARVGWSLNTALDVAVLAVWIALAALALRSPMPWSYKVWCWIAILAPLASGLTSSWTRYVYAAWPAFIVAATLFERASRPARWTLAVCLTYITLASLHNWHAGYFIS
jgi:hypothetical protein